LLIELQIIFGGEWLWKILIDGREISANQETFSQPAIGRSQIIEHPTNRYDGMKSRPVCQGRLVLVQAAEPSEQVGIPT
jgi:hypothetical protein